MELAKSSSPIRNDRLDVKLKTMLDMLETVELGSGTKTKLVDDEKRPQKVEQNQGISMLTFGYKFLHYFSII